MLLVFIFILMQRWSSEASFPQPIHWVFAFKIHASIDKSFIMLSGKSFEKKNSPGTCEHILHRHQWSEPSFHSTQLTIFTHQTFSFCQHSDGWIYRRSKWKWMMNLPFAQASKRQITGRQMRGTIGTKFHLEIQQSQSAFSINSIFSAKMANAAHT